MVWRHYWKLVSVFVQNRNSSPGNSDCWHENNTWWEWLVLEPRFNRQAGLFRNKKGRYGQTQGENWKGIAQYVLHSFYFPQMPSDNCLRKATAEPGLGRGEEVTPRLPKNHSSVCCRVCLCPTQKSKASSDFSFCNNPVATEVDENC